MFAHDAPLAALTALVHAHTCPHYSAPTCVPMVAPLAAATQVIFSSTMEEARVLPCCPLPAVPLREEGSGEVVEKVGERGLG